MKTYEEIINSDDSEDWDLTNERIQYIAAYVGDFMDHAEDIADKYLKAKGISGYSVNRKFGGGRTIGIEYETRYCSCCSPETDWEYMPIEYLWDKDLEKELNEIEKQRKVKEQKLLKQQKFKREAETKARDLKQLAKLKAKYKD